MISECCMLHSQSLRGGQRAFVILSRLITKWSRLFIGNVLREFLIYLTFFHHALLAHITSVRNFRFIIKVMSDSCVSIFLSFRGLVRIYILFFLLWKLIGLLSVLFRASEKSNSATAMAEYFNFRRLHL